MRILLISDTHGDLDLLEAIVQKTKVNAVIHAGDFGFYDKESVHRLQTRELFLNLVHSPFQGQVTKERDKLIEIIRENRLLGTFSDYLEQKKEFSVPIYAVWGNHEDLAVVEALRKKNPVHNLFLLDENHIYDFEGLRIFGIGGNWLPQKLFDPPLAGSGGKLWSSLSQFGTLYNNLKEKDGPALFVSHVSPDKEPLLVSLMTHFAYDLWISGHMGAPYPRLWNTINLESQPLPTLAKEMSKETTLALELLKRPLQQNRKPWFLNLPDAGVGHAILTIDQGVMSLETYGSGKSEKHLLNR
jgi:predicted phosphodiesterase